MGLRATRGGRTALDGLTLQTTKLEFVYFHGQLCRGQVHGLSQILRDDIHHKLAGLPVRYGANLWFGGQ